MDENGEWYCFDSKPIVYQSTSYFRNDTLDCFIPSEYSPKNFTQNWTKSLTKNPNK